MCIAHPPAAIRILLDLLDRAYDHKSWHGPNFRGAVRRVSAEVARWGPGPGRHSIAEQVLHASYWKYTVRRRIRGDRRGSFAIRGSNWFPVGPDLDDERWRDHLRLLAEEHRRLRLTVAELTPDRLAEVPEGGRSDLEGLISGIAAHDVYHAGQIQLLKRLHAN
ncbi:DinB family protein [Tautonia plasticadhaerens]|uniref:DinB superfamily protein n=1 Tax=Tautonia plasticadhaerens TaxID=2527974 RepID=A0A518GVI6_9BACT|nr:DinB family protein [Tautonia plasticadhaerens]QDV32568.1 DinB superfamily protein [Tautonia plasticadhaerens]